MTAIALVSGFDSQIMASKLLGLIPELRCVHFKAFSNSDAEIASAIVPIEIVDLAMPQDDSTAPDLTGRDLLMCAYVAMHYKAETIFIGAIKDDLHSYRDLSVDYVRKLSIILSETFGRQIMVRYPIVEWGMTKADLAVYALMEGIDTSKLVSCFNIVDGRSCGKCRKCFSRWIAERHAGIAREDLADEVIEQYAGDAATGIVASVVSKYKDEKVRKKALEISTPPVITPKTRRNRQVATA